MKKILVALCAVALLCVATGESQAGFGFGGAAVVRSRTVVRTRGVVGGGFGGVGFGRVGFVNAGFGRVGYGVGFNRFGFGGVGFNRFGVGYGVGGLGYGCGLGIGGYGVGVATYSCAAPVVVQPALFGVGVYGGCGAAYGIPAGGLLGAGVCP